jgi:hypothetical protein
VGQVAISTQQSALSLFLKSRTTRSAGGIHIPREETLGITFFPHFCRNNMDLALLLEISKKALGLTES